MNDGGFDFLLGAAEPARLTGVAAGVVTRTDDPDGLGRVKVRFPWLSGANESHWARVATPMSGPEIGLYLLPEVGDEVLVAFAHGCPELPYVLGGLWNGKARPPAQPREGEETVRLLRTPSFEIVIDEQQKRLVIGDRDGAAAGRNAVAIDAGAGTISLRCAGDVTIEAKGRLVLKGEAGVAIESPGEIAVKASADLALEANGMTSVKGATINLN